MKSVMKHLIIRNFGSIKNADIEMGAVNVITGLQSSGKSCVLKIACYCSWVEKRLEMTQKVNGFGKDSAFIDLMMEYYNMADYVKENSYIEYESSHLKFWYDHSARKFEIKWKGSRWNYRRPKVSYVPADRNLVAAIPAWSGVTIDRNMLDFMSDWDKARKCVKKEENFLNLGLTYQYDAMAGTDSVVLSNGKPLSLKSSSSGIQSLLPMFVHLDYLTGGQYSEASTQLKYEEKEERKNLRSTIYKNLYQKKQVGDLIASVTIDGFDYGFSDMKQAKRFEQIYNRYIKVDHSEIFLEEPEDNLFPPTQCQFVNWLMDAIENHDDFLFVATHSPYILNQFIKLAPKDLRILFTHCAEDDSQEFSVKTLSDEEIREIYENGVDMFFNFEMYV